MCLSCKHVAQIVQFSKSAYDIRIFLLLIYIFYNYTICFLNSFAKCGPDTHKKKTIGFHNRTVKKKNLLTNYKLTNCKTFVKHEINYQLSTIYLWLVFLNQLSRISDKNRTTTMATGFAAASTVLSHVFSLRSTGYGTRTESTFTLSR